jgi:hypothetical protein
MTDEIGGGGGQTVPPGERIVNSATRLLGIAYSEESPSGSDGDGHLWEPGEPLPDRLDCSGFVVVSLVSVGLLSYSRGNAAMQWKQHLGGVVQPDVELQPGDVGFFLGAYGSRSKPGHTGIVGDYDPKKRTGLLLNAYDSLRGSCEITFNREQQTNGMNGLGVVGWIRPANRIK